MKVVGITMGNQKNSIVLFFYILATSLLIIILGVFIYLNSDKNSDKIIYQSEIIDYSIEGEVVKVVTSSSLIIIKHSEIENTYVGILPETKIFNAQVLPTTIENIKLGNKLRVQIKFIGTGAVLASGIQVVE